MGKKSKIFLVFLIIAVAVPAILFGTLYVMVTRDAANRIQKGIILQVINSESPVYYDDGKTPIGVFFEKTHRRYVPYREIPKVFVKALVAAEDKNFFHHHGVDFKAIVRALLVNLKAGKVVQGGSTLTQQTAKNIFKRQKRSLMAKLKELIQAFLLERTYSKEEILEMYINQFFVAGFGKGLGIAAKYFFDKEVKDLNLVESAFIAGSVQAPNRYNPFIKKTEAEKRKARELAKQRKDYVLKNMLKLHFITQEQYEQAKDEPVPFRKGKISYRLNVILDYIRDQLDSDYFRTVLRDQGIDNIATSGIRIYTSVNKEIQEAALNSLRCRLPYLDVLLNGYRKEYKANKDQQDAQDLRKLGRAVPFLARITHMDPNNETACLVVTWKNGGGVIGYDGVRSMAEAWLKWKAGVWARLDDKTLRSFLRQFHEGDLVWVQFLQKAEGASERQLALTVRPLLNGGIVVLHDGMIKAMVGGFFNRFFNRAVDAKRQLGSIFKPIVYTAALQLKWSNLDALPNRRDLYEFEGTMYFPRPDHPPKSQKVSMAWAGVKSENLATVWLLYHLTDHLNLAEFRHVVDLLGLGRKENESYLDYKRRVRDRYGIVVNKNALMQAAFEEAKEQIRADLIFSGYEQVIPTIERLHYRIDPEDIPPDYAQHTPLARFSFERLRRLDRKMREAFGRLRFLLDEEVGTKPNFQLLQEIDKELRGFYQSLQSGTQDKIVYYGEDYHPENTYDLPLRLDWVVDHYRDLDLGKVWIDGLIPSEIITALDKAIMQNYKELLGHKRYDLEVLWRIRDFKTLVNLSYVVYLAKRLGISTQLDKVLSFPLGPNSISIMEAALAYQSIMCGKSYPLDDLSGPGGVPIITRIEDRNGEVLWEYHPQSVHILSSRESVLVKDILRKVVLHGTGRRAKGAVQLALRTGDVVLRIPVPAFGKTGTANRFTNSSFAGFIPSLDPSGPKWDSSKGFVIATYVGYDDNKPMKSTHTTIYGASGALPLWIDTANGIVNSPAYTHTIQLADLAFESLKDDLSTEPLYTQIGVSPVTGLPLPPEEQALYGTDQTPKVLSDAEMEGDKLILKQLFEPIGGTVQ
ncbi:MAG: hypothetical protein DRG63_00045 [Deltaproteobacteria bacterium]|nr:MAG: hypothetical protein DRG63_00045 [Deltaproteobacteria bacterium]